MLSLKTKYTGPTVMHNAELLPQPNIVGLRYVAHLYIFYVDESL
jgi:hypothetical protein